VAHRWQPCEIGGVVGLLRSENVRDDEVVGKAGDGLAGDSIALALFAIALFALLLPRASFLTGHCVGRGDGLCACGVRVVACVVRRGFREKRYEKISAHLFSFHPKIMESLLEGGGAQTTTRVSLHSGFMMRALSR
jgi:hypothetical protein